MFAEMTKKYVEAAVGAETQNAVEKFGLTYNSLHEGYAVLKEEVEEALEESKQVTAALDRLWSGIKNNDKLDLKNHVSAILLSAEQMALEAVQIAAVCNKILKGI